MAERTSKREAIAQACVQGRVSGSASKVKNMLTGADRRALDNGAGGRQKLLGGGFVAADSPIRSL
ncbi:MAG TPA: hypothetical protein VH307_09785 [Streptosporangiaceae bacterium]|nr:hypothetical protein [Streptosporangiaceae bacterium]